ncbi:alpha/beta fold hydrolase [Aestuariivirga sp.]|uniref:alpha/beta fold hydrolase n=1 Tax=Aestuariivirga sp. TaxID=2650926 RepID=UPI003BAD0203
MTSVATTWLKAEVDGEGAPVVLIHGLGGTSNSFQTLMGGLSGFRVIRPDLPGSGRSPLPHQPLTIDLLSEALIDAMRSLGANPAHLVGHSMGTIICQHIAAQKPDMVLSLALFGPIHQPADAARQRIRDRARTAREQGMVGVADASAMAGLSSSSKTNNPVSTAFLRESHMRQDAEGFAATCEALASATAADLRLIRCPALLVTGSEDAVAPPTAAQAMSDKIKSSKLKVLEQCGHWPMIEKPAESTRLLSDFLRGLIR